MLCQLSNMEMDSAMLVRDIAALDAMYGRICERREAGRREQNAGSGDAILAIS